MSFFKKIKKMFCNCDENKTVEDKPKEPAKQYGSIWDELCEKYAKFDIEDHFKVASLAQWILESGRGTSKLSKEHLNFGGLKWRSEMKGIATPVLIKVPSEDEPVEFCSFKTVDDFIKGYWIFIGRYPYKGWKDQTSAASYLEHIAKSGYATDPSYLKKVKSLLLESRKKLNASGADIEEDDRPNEPIDSKPYDMPEIKELPGDIRFDNQGSYRTATGFAKGLIVHYTVSSRKAKNAIGVARYMASKGLGCLVMDETGAIWVPKGWNWKKQWDDHAGSSSWKGKSSLSRYCMGMEICNWGRGANKGKAIPTREIHSKTDHRDAGIYQKYTTLQEEALINFCLWMADTNPEWDIDFVAGHDEVAPKRKSDPGGSLSTSMPKFRENLRKML